MDTRRKTRARGRGGGGALRWTPYAVAAANRRFWGRSDTIAGTTVCTAWNDVWGGAAFTPTNSPARNGNNPAYVGRVSVGFIEASGQFLTGPGAVGLYKALHDETVNVTIGGIFEDGDAADSTQILWATNNASGGNVGHVARRRTSTDNGVVFLNGNGTIQESVTIDNVAIPGVHSLVYQRVGKNIRVWLDGVNIRNVGWAVLSAADPQGVLRLAVRSAAASEFFEGTFGEFLWFTEARGEQTARYLESRIA